MLLQSQSPFLYLWPLESPDLLSITVVLSSLECHILSYGMQPFAFGFFHLASCFQMCVFQQFSVFLSLGSIPLYRCTTIGLSAHLLMDIWVVSGFQNQNPKCNIGVAWSKIWRFKGSTNLSINLYLVWAGGGEISRPEISKFIQ